MTLTFDLLTLKVASESCVGYIYANFGLPRPLCSRLRPDVRDRQTSDRRQTKASLNAPAYYGRGIIINSRLSSHKWGFVIIPAAIVIMLRIMFSSALVI